MQILSREVPSSNLTGLQSLDDPLLRRIYAARGLSKAGDLELSLSNLHSPELLPDIASASARLVNAVMHDQRILIVGDFDADGATSVALCMLVLRAMGAGNVEFIVPNRFEFGYGLSPEIVELAAQSKPAVIVTVDNGVSSITGVQRANELGIDVVVTDHHLPGKQRPDALALVNPNLPESTFQSRSMAGVGVAYYLLGKLRADLREQGWFEQRGIEAPNLAAFLDLVALGTVADVVPLDANNRILVHQGVARMRAGRCLPGIIALAEIAKRPLAKLTAQDLGFALGPRLNAAGRLEDMTVGIQCLLAPDIRTARKLATALDRLNKTRRELEQEMVGDAEIMIAQHLGDNDRLGLTVYHESFHQGVVGIVAGRVREKFNKPVIAFADANEASSDELKGSARSIDGLHIRDVLDAVATSHPGLLLKFGGHAMAAGLSIKRVHLQRFEVIFDKAVRAVTTPDMFQAQLLTDGALTTEEICIECATALSHAGPWGNGFAEPSFWGDFELVSQRVVGETHLKMVLKTQGRVVDAIAFRTPPVVQATEQAGVEAREQSVGQPVGPTGSPTARVEKVRVVYKLSVNDYGEWPTAQLIVEYVQALP